MALTQQRKTGSFYTEGLVAGYLADWAVRRPSDRVLEPAFGDGVFVGKALSRLASLGNRAPRLAGVEIQSEPFEHCAARFQGRIEANQGDFLAYAPEHRFDAVIGNPPYVGLKRLPLEQQATALGIVSSHSMTMPLNGSLWLPFVLHGASLLDAGGRLAFVLPFEITYAKYAADMWGLLSKRFSKLAVVRLYADFFPDVDVETVLLLADGKGGTTGFVDYWVFGTMDGLLAGCPFSQARIPVAEIAASKKPFVSSLLEPHHAALFRDLETNGYLTPILPDCKFKIGYVSADKRFFHPNDSDKKAFGLPDESFVPCILNAKELNGNTGVGVEARVGECPSRLFLPKHVTEQDAEYIRRGESQGVSQKYKCKRRKPWYVTPNVEIPDVILTVFGDLPKLVANAGGYAVSNSLLCGALRGGADARSLVARWYTSLTLLSLELTAHSLGGGSFVIVPGEADALSIAGKLPDGAAEHIYRELDACVRAKGLREAYLLGDKLVLGDLFGLPPSIVGDIRAAITELRSWRLPKERRALHAKQQAA